MSEVGSVGVLERPAGGPSMHLIPEFSAFMGESILPPSIDPAAPANKEEFLSEFPIRHDIWNELRTLRNDYSSETQVRLKRLGKFLHVLNSLDRYVTSHNENKIIGAETLWDEQLDVFESIRDGLEQGETEGYVKLPTGTGKTVLFTEFIEALGLATARGEAIKSLIVVPTTIPIGQTEKALQEFASTLPYGKVYGEQKDLGEKEKPVTIITDESLQIQIAKGNIDPNSYDLLVLDEAHNYLTEEKKKLIKDSFANAIKIGFTATPHYSEEKSVKSILPYEYASMTVSRAIEKGLLSNVVTLYARCGIDISDVRIDGQDYNEEDLEKTIDIKQMNDKFAGFYKENFVGESGIVSCSGVSHALHVADSFRERGIYAEAIHGYMSSDEKKTLIDKHESGEIQVLTFDRILSESYDQPRASICLNLRPTTSVVMAEQRAGRVLRQDKNNPSKLAKVIDVIYTDNRKSAYQVLYPEILGGSRVFGKVQPKSSSTDHKPYLFKEVVSAQGLEIIIDQEEVMSISQERMSQRFASPPENWLVMGGGYDRNPNALTRMVGRSEVWIKKRIVQAIANLERQNSTTTQESKIKLHGTFLSNGKIGHYYSPQLIQELQEIDTLKPSPLGWRMLGDIGVNQETSLKQYIGKSENWILKRIPQVILELEKEQADKPDEEKKAFTGVFKNNSGRSSAFYSPEVAEKIKKMASEHTASPDGWHLVGHERDAGTLVFILGKNSSWVKARISGVLEKLEESQKDLPDNEKSKFSEKFLEKRGHLNMYYSPEVLEELKKERDKLKLPPPGWLIVGDRYYKHDSLATVLGRNDKWIKRNIPKALELLAEKQENLPPSERKIYVGEFLNRRSKISTFYAPEVKEILQELSA